MSCHLRTILTLLLAALLAACGGGGDNGSSTQPFTSSTTILEQEPNAPQASGNTATDGFNWFNFRRQQMGVAAVTRNSLLDIAAQGHSDYQRINDEMDEISDKIYITHTQTVGRPGFTGEELGDRLAAVGYHMPLGGYAGEVISATSDPSGFNAAEDLIAAIYHRFLIFEPMFKEAGVGAATVPDGLTYFTTNFGVNGLDNGLRTPGTIVMYPFADQQRVPRNFFSDYEEPDPVPNLNEVGYPISVHANITSTIAVQSFTVRLRGGTNLTVRQLWFGVDPYVIRPSAAAIVPLDVLAPATTYDVQFSGTVDGVAVNRAWSFTTQ